MTSLPQEFYTPQELADLFRVTTRTVARLVERGELTATRIGQSVRFQRSDIERYVDGHKDAGSSEPSAPPLVVPDAQPMSNVTYWTQESPIGPLTVLVSNHGLCRIAFGDDDVAPIFKELQRPKFGRPAMVIGEDESVRRQLEEYFDGSRRAFDLQIDLSMVSEGRRPYVQALMEIPYGTTVAYKDIAARAGKPRGAQAAGQAVGHNPIPIVAPCHRVLAADGTLGGYGGGLNRKRFLLKLEGLGEFEGGWQKRRRADEGLPD